MKTSFCPVAADEARYNDGRFDAAVESLMDEWTAEEGEELDDALNAAVNHIGLPEFLVAVMRGGARRDDAIDKLQRVTSCCLFAKACKELGL